MSQAATRTGALTLEQQRAKHALTCIKEVQGRPSRQEQQSYRSYVESLPTTIVTSGLGQAVAMLLARIKSTSAEGKAYELLHKHLEQWLTSKAEPKGPYEGAKSLLEAIIERDQDVYVRAHAEALAYVMWLKRLAQAFLERKPETTSHGK